MLEAPFRLLGDIRILHVIAALITSVAVLVLARRAGTLDRTACVVMVFPLTIGMIIFSWVDVLTMAGLAVWLVSFRSHPKIATVALVLVLALGAKPTTLIALVPSSRGTGHARLTRRGCASPLTAATPTSRPDGNVVA